MVAFLVINGRWWCLKDLRTLPDLIVCYMLTPTKPPRQPRLAAKKKKITDCQLEDFISSGWLQVIFPFQFWNVRLPLTCLKGEQGAGHLFPGHHAHLFGHLDAVHMILVILVQYTWSWSSGYNTHDLGHIGAVHLTWRSYLFFNLCGYLS